MRTAWAQLSGVLLLVLSMSLDAEPALIVGAVGALLLAWGVARPSALPVPLGAGPAVAARAHHGTLAARAVPRQRDPDAAGHIRSRAPSDVVPAV